MIQTCKHVIRSCSKSTSPGWTMKFSLSWMSTSRMIMPRKTEGQGQHHWNITRIKCGGTLEIHWSNLWWNRATPHWLNKLLLATTATCPLGTRCAAHKAPRWLAQLAFGWVLGTPRKSKRHAKPRKEPACPYTIRRVADEGWLRWAFLPPFILHLLTSLHNIMCLRPQHAGRTWQNFTESPTTPPPPQPAQPPQMWKTQASPVLSTKVTASPAPPMPGSSPKKPYFAPRSPMVWILPKCVFCENNFMDAGEHGPTITLSWKESAGKIRKRKHKERHIP